MPTCLVFSGSSCIPQVLLNSSPSIQGPLCPWHSRLMHSPTLDVRRSLVRYVWEIPCDWLVLSILRLVSLNIGWGYLKCSASCIEGSRGCWEFPSFFTGHWQSLGQPWRQACQWYCTRRPWLFIGTWRWTLQGFQRAILGHMVTSSNGNIFRVTSHWPFVRGIHRSPVDSPHKGQWRGTLMFFFALRLNKRLSKQSKRRWFEAPSCPLWRHCNEKHGYWCPVFSVRQRSEVVLTHWDRVTHICVSNLTIIGSDNGLSPCRRQAIIWTNAGLLIGPLGTNFNEILIEIHTFSFKKMHSKMSSVKWRPFCLGLNVLRVSSRPKPSRNITPIMTFNVLIRNRHWICIMHSYTPILRIALLRGVMRFRIFAYEITEKNLAPC